MSDTHKHDRPPFTGEASEGAGPSGQVHRLIAGESQTHKPAQYVVLGCDRSHRHGREQRPSQGFLPAGPHLTVGQGFHVLFTVDPIYAEQHLVRGKGSEMCWMDGRMDGGMDRRTDGWMDRWRDGWTMEGWMDNQM